MFLHLFAKNVNNKKSLQKHNNIFVAHNKYRARVCIYYALQP